MEKKAISEGYSFYYNCPIVIHVKVKLIFVDDFSYYASITLKRLRSLGNSLQLYFSEYNHVHRLHEKLDLIFTKEIGIINIFNYLTPFGKSDHMVL